MVQRLNSISNTRVLQVALAALFLGQSVLFYTKNLEMKDGFEYIIGAGKVLLPVAFILLFYPLNFQRKFSFIFVSVSFILFSDSVFAMTQNKYAIEQLIEHFLKFGLPLFYVFHNRLNLRTSIFLLKSIVALTFIGHGLFAVGWHFVPGGFIQMTQNILGLDVPNSHSFLMVVGIIDFVVAISIFIKPFELPAMVYMVIWGALTSIARFVGYYHHAPTEEVYSVYLFETIWRAPHFMMPILMISLYLQGRSFTLSKKFFTNPRKALDH